MTKAQKRCFRCQAASGETMARRAPAGELHCPCRRHVPNQRDRRGADAAARSATRSIRRRTAIALGDVVEDLVERHHSVHRAADRESTAPQRHGRSVMHPSSRRGVRRRSGACPRPCPASQISALERTASLLSAWSGLDDSREAGLFLSSPLSVWLPQVMLLCFIPLLAMG
jgi:hypothetical protein